MQQAKEGKKAKYQLGVFEAKLGSAIQDTTAIPCVCNEFVGEVLRGIRMHFTRFLDDLKDTGRGTGGTEEVGVGPCRIRMGLIVEEQREGVERQSDAGRIGARSFSVGR